MGVKDVLCQSDFFKLTNDDVDNIIKKAEIDIVKGVDPKTYLYSMKDVLFSNEDVRSVIESKAFSGRVSLNWYEFTTDKQKDELIGLLESDRVSFNKIKEIDINKIDSPAIYTCISLGEAQYLIRVMAPAGARTVNNGLDVNKISSIDNSIVIIDLDKKYIEIRAKYKNAKKIVEIIKKALHFDSVREKPLLAKYHNSLEEFKNTLCNGKFTDVTSVPVENIDLTKEQNEVVFGLLELIDEFCASRDTEKLVEDLSECNIELLEGQPFTQLFLSGMSKLGIGIRPDIGEDLSCQSLYKSLKSYTADHSGFLSFSTCPNGVTHTIQVGITTNSISFRTSATEEAIEYIRNQFI